MSTRSELANKILQLILLSTDASPTVVREYIRRNVLTSYKNDLKIFLMDKEIKHKIVHLHYNATPCCDCSKRFNIRGKRSPVIDRDQFHILYSETGTKLHEKKDKQGHIIQHCFCFQDPVAALDDLDLSLIWILLNNCCQRSPGIHFIEALKKIRNYVSHLPSFDKVSEDEVDEKIKDIQTTMHSLSVYITPGKGVQDIVRKQTLYITMGTFNAADVYRIVAEGNDQQTQNTLNIKLKLEEIEEALKDHTTTLANNIIAQGNENTGTIVEKMKESTDDLKDTLEDCHIAETLHLKSIQEHQEILLETQFEQCESIVNIDDMASNTLRQQNEQTKMITRIDKEMTAFEGIDEKMASKDDIEKIVQFSEKVQIERKEQIVLIEKETQTEIGSSETGNEYLGNNLTTFAKGVLLGKEPETYTTLQNIQDEPRDTQSGSLLQQQRILIEVEKLVKENRDLNSQIQKLKEGKCKTFFETAGYEKEDCKVTFNRHMVDGILEKLQEEKLAKRLVPFCQVVQALLQRSQYTMFKLFHVSHWTPVVDHFEKCLKSFTAIGENMKNISKIAKDLVATLELFTSLIKSESFYLVRQTLPDVFTSICRMLTEIEDLASDNKKRTFTVQQEVNLIRKKSHGILSLEGVESSCEEIGRFMSTFCTRINSISSISNSLLSRSKSSVDLNCLNCQYLIAEFMCNDVCCLYQDVTQVKFVTSCYMEMSDTVLFPCTNLLHKFISSEVYCWMDLDELKCNKETVEKIIVNQKKSLETYLNDFL